MPFLSQIIPSNETSLKIKLEACSSFVQHGSGGGGIGQVYLGFGARYIEPLFGLLLTGLDQSEIGFVEILTAPNEARTCIFVQFCPGFYGVNLRNHLFSN